MPPPWHTSVLPKNFNLPEIQTSLPLSRNLFPERVILFTLTKSFPSFQFDLVCDKALYGTIATSLVYLGSLIGCLVISTISDKFGRKKAIFGAGFGIAVFSLLSAFPNVYWLFAALRFFVGFGFGMYTSFIVERDGEVGGVAIPVLRWRVVSGRRAATGVKRIGSTEEVQTRPKGC